jgi:hypothetical protein
MKLEWHQQGHNGIGMHPFPDHQFREHFGAYRSLRRKGTFILCQRDNILDNSPLE